MYKEFIIHSRPHAIEAFTRRGPDFQSKGKFQFALRDFQYKPEDYLCKYCLYTDSYGRCKMAVCKCLTERVEADNPGAPPGGDAILTS